MCSTPDAVPAPLGVLALISRRTSRVTNRPLTPTPPRSRLVAEPLPPRRPRWSVVFWLPSHCLCWFSHMAAAARHSLPPSCWMPLFSTSTWCALLSGRAVTRLYPHSSSSIVPHLSYRLVSSEPAPQTLSATSRMLIIWSAHHISKPQSNRRHINSYWAFTLIPHRFVSYPGPP